MFREGVLCDIKKDTRTVVSGFRRLYCERYAVSKQTLEVPSFLDCYFNNYQDQRGFLPNKALVEDLSKALPERSQQLISKIRAIRSDLGCFSC